MGKKPRLRTANKIAPPYPLGDFPKGFAQKVGKQIIYLLYTKPFPSLEGPEWERIFANAIGAEWKPSNVGLDDIVLGNCAWGAKTVTSPNPFEAQRVRLISGRNSPIYSYGTTVGASLSAEKIAKIGEEVLGIWNARVESIRAKFPHVRTVVLLKSRDLLRLAIFEIETLRYDPSLYTWRVNKRGNLEGWRSNQHCFTWQPHGSQFTIIESVPDNKICLKLRDPGRISENAVLESLNVDDSWIEIIEMNEHNG